MSKKFFSKMKLNKFKRLFQQSDVHYILGGLGGIGLYKLMNAVTHKLPDLRRLVGEESVPHSSIASSEAQDGVTNFE